MNVYDVIALTIHSNDMMIEGRTVMQKLIYFNSIKIPTIQIQSYAHHFYGPFSSEVATALEEMFALSYLNKIIHSGFYDSYTYLLTAKGKKFANNLTLEHPKEHTQISKIVKKCREFCELKPEPLSFAAKAHHILVNTKKTRGKYSLSDVQDVAKDFDWNISKKDVKIGMSLLEELGFVQTLQK